MADIMVKILMKGAKAIGKTAVILIIWTAHKLENKYHIKILGGSSYVCKC